MNMNVNNVCFMIRMFLMVLQSLLLKLALGLSSVFPFLLYMFVFTGPMPWPYQIFWIAVLLDTDHFRYGSVLNHDAVDTRPVHVEGFLGHGLHARHLRIGLDAGQVQG